MSMLLNVVTRMLILMLRVVVAPVSRLIQIGKYEKCPPIRSKYLTMSGTKLVQMIKTKQVTSEEVVHAFIERCKEVNPVLNAIVDERYELALEEAREVDRLTATNPETVIQKALLGLPITVKESIGVQGMSNNSGRKWPNGPRIAELDAYSVELAKAAGAIVIAVSNTPELCMNWETYNKITGVTRNPYDTRRTPAGSSGGEAALISSGASIMGIASDIGGSLRLPAMFTGIYGHKPSPGVVSPEGHVPGCTSKDWYKYFTIGPMTRYAEDLPLLLKSISDPKGPETHLDEPVDAKKLKFFYMEDDGGSMVTDKISSDVHTAFINAIEKFSTAKGVAIEKVQISKMKKVFNFSVNILLGVNGVENIYRDEKNPEKLKSVIPEIVKSMFFLSNATIGPLLYGPAKKLLGDVSDAKMKKFMEMNTELRNEFQKLLGDNGVFLYPTFPHVAHYHNEIFHNFTNTMYMLIFNTIGLPVTNCPVGLTSEGLPVGLQIVANPALDRLTIGVAQEFEKIFGGWVPPPASEATPYYDENTNNINKVYRSTLIPWNFD